MQGYLKLKQVDEELYEINLESALNKDNLQKGFWNRIKTFFYSIYFWIVVQIKKCFHIITVKEIYSGLIFILPFSDIEQSSKNKTSYTYFQRQITKCIPKVKKLMKKYQITSLVISENLRENKKFMEKLLPTDRRINNVQILNGKGLMPYLIKEIFEYILQKQEKNIALEDLYILIKKDSIDYKENIVFLSQYFKTINIVTTSVKSYQKFANQLEEKKDIMMTVTNNKRKSLRNAKWIVNFDMPIEEMNKYTIYRDSAIIYLEEEERYQRNAFDGICIYNAGIDVSQEVKEVFLKQYLLDQCPITILYESTIIGKKSLLLIKEQMKKDKVSIKRLYGKRGILSEEEYKKVG